MKVVITRDKNGYIEFWPISFFESLYKNKRDYWITKSPLHEPLFCLEPGCPPFQSVCKILGFTPRKGSKQVVDITVKRLKK